MKKLIPILLIMGFVTTMLADNYKILLMNTKTVKIGSRVYKKGETFSGDSVIFWEKDKQALKAQNLTTKEIRLFAEPEFKARGCKTIKDYYVKINHLSTRGNILVLKDLAEYVTKIGTFYLLDTIYLESPMMPVDSTRYFYLSYNYAEKTEKKVLKMKEDSLIIIDRTLFPRAKDLSELKLSMLYYSKGDNDYLLSDSMKVVLIPERIKQ